jgi:recombination protein RecA
VFIENVVKKTKLRWPNKEKLITIVIDSVAALESLEEVEKEATDASRIGPEARAWSRCLKKYIDILDEGFVTIVLINQLRTKTTSMPFQDPDITPGGRSIAFYCSVRIKLKSLKQIKDNSTGRTVGVKSEARIFKNKIAPGHRNCFFPIMYDWGIQDEQSIYDYFWDRKLITGQNVNKVLEDKDANAKFEFKHGQWSKELSSNPQLAEYVKNYLDKDMIIPFEKKPELDIDVDSILEVQQLKDELEEE